MKTIGVGIIGAGLIGGKRAAAIKNSGKGRLVAVSDVDFGRAKALADQYHCLAYGNWRELLKNDDVAVVIVSVPIGFTVPIAVEALKRGKHVLCEKPLGRNAREAKKILEAARKYRKVLRVGFNHRFHAGIAAAKRLCDEGKIGKLMFIRARYGYGGRKGMEKEWRMNKKISGGGELLDQGVHVIDLARWFGGEPERVYGLTQTKFWKTNVDDNAFVVMSNESVTTEFHVSSTNWKNIFSFEIFGEWGYLEVNGKGGSYGEETLTFGRRKKEFGVPDIKVFTFKGDMSWIREWESFFAALAGKATMNGNAFDGYAVNKIVDSIYRSSSLGKSVNVDLPKIS